MKDLLENNDNIFDYNVAIRSAEKVYGTTWNAKTLACDYWERYTNTFMYEWEKCQAGCKHFTEGVQHHKDCFYFKKDSIISFEEFESEKVKKPIILTPVMLGRGGKPDCYEAWVVYNQMGKGTEKLTHAEHMACKQYHEDKKQQLFDGWEWVGELTYENKKAKKRVYWCDDDTIQIQDIKGIERYVMLENPTPHQLSEHTNCQISDNGLNKILEG